MRSCLKLSMLALTLTLLLSACAPATTPSTPQTTTGSIHTSTHTTAPTNPLTSSTTETSLPTTTETTASPIEDLSPESILAAIYAEQPPTFETHEEAMKLNQPQSVKYFLGLDDSTQISRAYLSESTVTVDAYSLIIVEAKDGADVAALAKDIEDKQDPLRWVCVGADDVTVAHQGRFIMPYMADSDLNPKVTSKTLTDQFLDITKP